MSKYNNFSALPFYGLQDGTYESWDCNKWYAWGQLYPLIVPEELIPFFFKKEDNSPLVKIEVYKLCKKSGNEISLSDFIGIDNDNDEDVLTVSVRGVGHANILSPYVGKYYRKGDNWEWENNPNIKWSRVTIPDINGYALYDYSSGVKTAITSDPLKIIFFVQQDYSLPIGNKIIGLTALDATSSENLGDAVEKSSSGASWISKFRSSGLVEDNTTNTITFPTGIKLFDNGYYYMKFKTANGNLYYSEIFKVEKRMGGNSIKMEWRNYPGDASDMDLIPYSKNYRNRIFVESTLGMPSYEYEEEGEKRSGYFYPTRQLSYKKYKFTFIAPEYLCDVLRLVPMSDEIKITDSMGIILEPTDFNIDFNWLDGGHYAKVDCEFTTDTVVKKIGGMRLYNGRSFGNDFGDDFGNDRGGLAKDKKV